MRLRIVTPEHVVFDGQIQSVSVPGTKGGFEILSNHAPIISTLEAGTVVYVTDVRNELPINGGFVHVVKDDISLCVELK